ncbi:hypothetical protein SAMN05421504_11077 [Amycolatopsis xylanica]|uniref:Uncharacterized protein n=1 Tax=Amycolatopsis xylanica TaxID=589385 RepID=A0A1H3QUJ8_9PSEU|nr:hypothetical protein [Amycolatopsis xylanica]SDZ16695.1 hypothetical protein SAMN05421504_11077 [Amycolatopsis xylanica]
MKTQLRAVLAAVFTVLALAGATVVPSTASAAPVCVRPCHW